MKPLHDQQREDRIHKEAIVDCYDAEEQAMGWYYYLQDKCTFPFQATVIKKRSNSPLKPDETVQVIDMANEEECEHKMFVTILWQNEKLDVPLAQLFIPQEDFL